MGGGSFVDIGQKKGSQEILKTRAAGLPIGGAPRSSMSDTTICGASGPPLCGTLLAGPRPRLGGRCAWLVLYVALGFTTPLFSSDITMGEVFNRPWRKENMETPRAQVTTMCRTVEQN